MSPEMIRKPIPKRSHLVMTVSLSATIFNKSFFERLFDWIREIKCRRLSVIFFDSLETINYTVFKGLERGEAFSLAIRRASELQRMVQSVMPSHDICYPNIELLKESEVEEKADFKYKNAERLNKFRCLYSRHESFRNDVHSQIVQNLQRRLLQHGELFFSNNLNRIAEYLLGELAFFETYWEFYPNAIEIYPGSNLFLKENLWCGRYEKLGLRSQQKTFCDILFLAY